MTPSPDMTLEQAYAFGFLLRCADEGLAAADFEKRAEAALVKQAEPSGLVAGAASVGKPAYDMAKNLFSTGTQVGYHGLVTLPLLALLGGTSVGGLAGREFARAGQGDIDEKDVRSRELTRAYLDATSRLHAMARRNQASLRPAAISRARLHAP